MKHRLLALPMALCLLMAATAAPAATTVRLVCRMSGRPMTPVVESGDPSATVSAAAARRPCCVVRMRQEAAGVRFVLAARSCCDLKITAGRSPLPAFHAPTPISAPAAVRAEAAAFVPTAAAVDLPAAASAQRESVPRAPPGRPTSLRAPPTRS
jgi:hypothetical protein